VTVSTPGATEGFRFTALSNTVVNALGVFTPLQYGPAMSQSHDVGLWQVDPNDPNNGFLLGKATIDPTDPLVGFLYHLILDPVTSVPAPVTLIAITQYAVGAYFQPGVDSFTASVPFLGINFTNFTTDARIAFGGNAAGIGTSLGFLSSGYPAWPSAARWITGPTFTRWALPFTSC
jgi:hypothetical protein